MQNKGYLRGHYLFQTKDEFPVCWGILILKKLDNR
jgi:hypothetical protein